MRVIVAILGVAVLALFVGLWLAIVRAVKTVKFSPSPKEDSISKDGDDIERRIDEQAEKDKAEVQNASGEPLADLFRKRMLRK